ELERARAYMERATIESTFVRALSRANTLSEHATVFGDPGRANERLPAMLAVTPAQVSDAAREVFRPDNRVTLVYVPEGSR
ncbi:MAG: insulinase family protein, partial [Actinomycetota bacterium]